MTWAIDGVPIPNTNIASNVGPQIDPKDDDYLEAQRGGYSSASGSHFHSLRNIRERGSAMTFRIARRHFSCFVAIIGFSDLANAQSLGNAGTIEGTVVDQSGASIPQAQVRLTNAVSGYTQTVTSGQDGSFRLVNIPPE
jgi:hypothetical protein